MNAELVHVTTADGLRLDGALRSPAAHDPPAVMGADAFLGLCGWHLWQRVFDLAHIIVAHRPGTSFDAWESAMPSALVQELRHRLTTDASALVNNAYGKILLQRITLLDLSSSAIRREIRRGRSVQYLLPDGVLDYIQRNRLYRDADED